MNPRDACIKFRVMPLLRVSPTAAGVDPAGIIAFLDAASRAGIDLHSLMIARHGEVLAEGWWEPYSADRVHLGYSLSKSFTATAIGLLVDDGVIGLDDLVMDHLPDVDRAAVTPGYERLRVRHCLSMTTGHLAEMWSPELMVADGLPGDAVVRRIFALPLPAEPGTVFTYNQIATYLLGAIVRAITDGDILDLLRARVFEPLGWGEAYWHVTPDGRQLGFSGIHVTTEAILSLAQLYLDGGVAGGRRILSESYAAEAVRGTGAPRGVPDPEAGPDWNLGYGFSFWQARHGYRGDGAFGQFAIVLPEQQMTIAITSEVDNMQEVLDLVWAHILPAVDRVSDRGFGSDSALTQRLARLECRPLASISLGRDWVWSLTDAFGLGGRSGSVAVARSRGHWELTVEFGRTSGAHEVIRLPIGDGQWLAGDLTADGVRLPVMCCGSFSGSEFRADIRLIETPHTVRLRTVGSEATFAWRYEPLSGAWPFWLAVHRADPGINPPA